MAIGEIQALEVQIPREIIQYRGGFLAFGMAEEVKIHHGLRPKLATPNTILLDLRTMFFRDYSKADAVGIPTIVDAPYAGHSAVVADYYKGQSLVEVLLAEGLDRIFLTDWKSATEDMKDLEIDEYLAELNVCIELALTGAPSCALAVRLRI